MTRKKYNYTYRQRYDTTAKGKKIEESNMNKKRSARVPETKEGKNQKKKTETREEKNKKKDIKKTKKGMNKQKSDNII